MKTLFLTPIVLIAVFLLCIPAAAATPYIVGPQMTIEDNNIIVNIAIKDAEELEATIKSGIKKEIVFTVELLRVWNFWPDEFIVSRKISKIIKYDNLRELYTASSYDGLNRTEKHFNNFTSLRTWLFNVEPVNLAGIKTLDPSSYYIRVVVETKSLEELPLLGFLTHFIPEVDMSLAKESGHFVIEGTQ